MIHVCRPVHGLQSRETLVAAKEPGMQGGAAFSGVLLGETHLFTSHKNNRKNLFAALAFQVSTLTFAALKQKRQQIPLLLQS
jgi:hypothetical protein